MSQLANCKGQVQEAGQMWRHSQGQAGDQQVYRQHAAAAPHLHHQPIKILSQNIAFNSPNFSSTSFAFCGVARLQTHSFGIFAQLR